MERTFSQTMSELRKARGYSQRKVAEDLNISQALLSHYENGVREPGLNFVCRACDYYGVSADYLLCRSEHINPGKDAADSAMELLESMQQLLDKARQEIELSTEEDKT